MLSGSRASLMSMSRSARLAPAVQPSLPNGWIRHRRDTADRRCAGRERRRRDKELIPLRRRRTTGHERTRKGVDVGKRCCETVREGSQEDHDHVLLAIRQAELPNRHVEVVWGHLGPGPAVYFFSRSCRAVSRRDVKRKHVARIVEVDELLQALDVAIVEEPLLEVGPWCLGGTTWWRHGHIARRRHLELAVGTRRQWYPLRVRVGSGTETASQEGAQS